MPILELSADDIDGGGVPCSGVQVATVFHLLAKQPETEACDWYAGALGRFGPPLVLRHSGEPKLIDRPDIFTEQIRSVVQFDDGIIFAMKGNEAPVFLQPDFSTLFHRGRKVGNSVVELHAFDTSWIELYSDEMTLMKRLAEQFPGAKWHH